ncbi:hypothetical protein ACOMHN_034743 [Nucella lapillus]
MEISDEKSKTLLNSTSNLAKVNIKMNGQKLEEMDSFKYLVSTITKDGSVTKEIRTRMSLVPSAMTKLDTIWKSSTISLPVKIRLTTLRLTLSQPQDPKSTGSYQCQAAAGPPIRRGPALLLGHFGGVHYQCLQYDTTYYAPY